MKKHSITIKGHATSITLEDEFWTELKSIAAARDISVQKLVTQIDRARGENNLSSAIRVFILKECKGA
jgi:predicted DNA-binding ribbon-helix-helix protein